MNYPHAIVLAAALIAGAIVVDKLPSVAVAQNVPEGYGFRAENAVAGERLWWVESRVQHNRVYMCIDIGNGLRCRFEDIPK